MHGWLGLLAAMGVPRLVLWLSPPAVRVLMYHGVCADDGPEAPPAARGKHVRRREFRRQMAWLARHMRPLSMEQVVSYLERGTPLPRRGVVVTLDDGYHNNFTVAAPILEELGIPATIYVTTGLVAGRALWVDRVDAALERLRERGGVDASPAPRDTRRRGKLLAGRERERFVRALTGQAGLEPDDLLPADRPADARGLTPETLPALRQAGLTIGAHTVHHEILTRCSDQELRAEVEGSRQALEAMLGAPVEHFAYPNGGPDDFDARTEAALRAAGFRSAVLTVQGPVRPGDSPWRMRRIPVNGHEGMAEFLADLSGIRPWLLRLRRRLRRQGSAQSSSPE
jgi:peptidoglycan/xylan/chitin deacetylase (PgdA/CDA1 family)